MSSATRAVFTGAWIFLWCSAGARAQVFLNEIYVSHSGTDNQEFIELVGTPGASLNNHMVLIVEGEQITNGTLDRAWDLTGLTIPPSGHFVLGDTAVSPNNFNIGTQDRIENGAETFYLVDAGSPSGVNAIIALVGSDVSTPPASLATVTVIPSMSTVRDIIAIYGTDPTDLTYDGAQVLGPDLAGPFFPAGVFRDQDAPNSWCNANWLDFDASGNLNRPRTPGTANASCAAAGGGGCWQAFQSPGIAGDVLALSVFDEDGLGANPPRLFAGGRFAAAGGTPTGNIVRWNGSSFSAVGSPNGVAGGRHPHVEAMLTFDDGGGTDLYVAGSFTSAGGVNAQNIARWDGTSWSALGAGLDDTALALAVFDEDGAGPNPPRLFAGGIFLRAGASAAFGIARWNGSSWSALGTGTDGAVAALAVFDPPGALPAGLYAGGRFTVAGGSPRSNIARWNGSTWSSLGTGTSGDVQALKVFGSSLYAGGAFLNAGGIQVGRIARWDLAWSAVGSGLLVESDVRALEVFDDGLGAKLHAGGAALSTPVVPHFFLKLPEKKTSVGRWNGSTWSKAGAEIADAVRAFTAFNGQLYAAGQFQHAAPAGSSRIARLQAGTWQPLSSGSGMGGVVTALAFADTGGGPMLHAGGDFAAAGTSDAARIARWNGSSWSPLAGGFGGRVAALGSVDVGGGPKLFAGGDFSVVGSSADPESLPYVAEWTGSGWSDVGGGMDDSVRALCAFDHDGSIGTPPRLIAGGLFTSAGGLPANRIASWNGAAWSQLGTGITGPVYAVASLDLDGPGGNPPVLCAGGDFNGAGGSPCANVARWNGAAWSPLGAPGMGADDVVRALCAFDDGSGMALYAGGDFTTTGGNGATFVARWNGSAWSAVGTGFNGPVHALSVHGGRLVAAGEFTKAGVVSANHVAVWNGLAWSAIGQGMDAPVLALSEPNAIELWAGGEFTLADALPASYVTRLNCSLP